MDLPSVIPADVPPALGRGFVENSTEADRDYVRRTLRPLLPEFCEWVKRGLYTGNRTAINAYSRLMALFEPDINMIVVLTKELGVGSMEEARAKISAASEAEPLTGDRKLMAQRMLEWLNDYHAPLGKKVVVLDEAR